MCIRDSEYGFYWYAWLWNLIRPVLIGLISLLICAGVLLSGWTMVYDKLFKPMDESDTSTVPFKIESGSSVSLIARNLEEQGFLRSKTLFKTYVQFQGLTSKIQSGEYQLSPSMTFTQIASVLSSGTSSQERTITIIPGWTVEDVADYLVEKKVLSSPDEFLELCRTGESYAGYYFIEDVLTQDDALERKYALEGYLSPNTYEIYTSSSADTIVRRLLSQTEAAYLLSYDERAQELGMTMDEVFTLASMIEKEAKKADFAKVSAVFHNRLKAGMTLDSDVTVKYASGSQKMYLNSDDLSVDSAYNTYRRKGLPVGPVCNPSMDAVVAALYPDEQYLAQKYLYFCSTDPDSGELHFSKTLEEHQAAAAMYQPLWEEYDRKRGL